MRERYLSCRAHPAVHVRESRVEEITRTKLCVRETDSSIVSPQNQPFSVTVVSWLLGTRKDAMTKHMLIHFFVFFCKGLWNGDVAVARGTFFQEIRPGAGFKTGDSLKKSWCSYRRTTWEWYRIDPARQHDLEQIVQTIHDRDLSSLRSLDHETVM